MFFFGSGLFEFMFFTIFTIVVVMFIIVFVRAITQWGKNNQSPRLTVKARVVSKRQNTSHHHHNTGNSAMHHHNSTYYYITFQVESGDRIELSVSGRNYGLIADGDAGNLSFQGTRFLSFERTLS